MPPALQLNPESGFLDSPNSLSSFSTPKKLRFFEIADQYRKDTGKWPDTSSICESVGVSMRCFYHHLEIDKLFKTEWEERLLRGEARLTSKLADMNNPIGPLAVLRRYFPDRWNPQPTVGVTVNVQTNERLAVDARQFIDVTPVNELPSPSEKPVV